MANQWLRLWHDMPTDPKWRTIAKVSGQRIGDVMAVYVHLLVCASNATERGRTQSFNAEDVASALDLETDQVKAIVDAMQGRVIDGESLTGWDKRQVAREDGSAERAKAWRESKKNATHNTMNASERKRTPDKDTDKDKNKNREATPAARATRLPFEQLPVLWKAYCESARKDLDPQVTFENFRDYWVAEPGKGGTKLDWDATWRKWVRSEKPNRAGSGSAGMPWWSSDATILAKGKEFNLEPRIGEQMSEFKGRINVEIGKRQGMQ